jgi:hypothetical protein
MNPDTTPPKPAKSSPKPDMGRDRGNPLEDGAIRIRKLSFARGVDLPTEQQRASISDAPRTGLPAYRIWFLPRIDKYLVRSWEPGKENGPPSHTFLIPGDWAVAEFAEP